MERVPARPAEPTSISASTWLAPLSVPLALAGGGAEPATSLPDASEEAVKDAYAKLPLSFVENAGQLDRRVRYYAQRQGFGVYFTPDKPVLSLTKGKRGVALQLTPLGASPKARLVAAHRGQGRVNYLVGSERHTNLPTYHELTYRGLWPGIDMVFRGQGGRLKYEFRLAPGADPAQIRLAYRGASGMSLGRPGELLIKTPLGTLRDSRPLSYQRIGSERVPIESRYVLGQDGSVYGFALGAHDPRRAIVIDPALVYSTFLGGGGFETGQDVAVDAAGNAYVTGSTSSASDFPTTAGAFDTTHGPDFDDSFVTKLNPAGSAAVYSTFLGGSEGDYPEGIAIDGAGSAYVTGQTFSADFPTSPGAFDPSYNGSYDAFVTKLNATGSDLAYSTYLGGTDTEQSEAGIALDAAGNAYVTGGTRSPEFPTTAGAFDRTHNGGLTDAYVTKLNATGSALVYSTFLGAEHEEHGAEVALDGAGRAYVTGATRSDFFPTTAGAFDRFNAGADDVFVTKLNEAGSALLYSTYLGGGGEDSFPNIAIDAAGNAYVAGFTQGGTLFPTTPGAFDPTPSGPPFAVDDAFVTKLNPTGSGLVYSTFLGGSNLDGAHGVALDVTGNAYVTGHTLSEDFPTTPGALDTTLSGGIDSFVTKLNASGSALAYSTYLGGPLEDRGFAIALDNARSAYVTGLSESPSFPTTSGAFDTSFNGNDDVVVTKLNLNQCSDGRDNDGDGRIDFPADPGCSSASDDDELDPVRVLFGKTAIGSAFGLLDHNEKYGSRFYLFTADPVTVTKLRAYLDGRGRTSGSQVLRGLIYKHTSTGPGALVARTFQASLNAGRPAGWVDLYFPYPPRLSAGGYWLTIHAGESENVVRYAFDVKSGGQRHNDDLFSNGPLDPFGGSDKAAREMSIHAVGR